MRRAALLGDGWMPYLYSPRRYAQSVFDRFPRLRVGFLENPKLSDDSKRRILWENAPRYYGFDESNLPTGAALTAADSA